MQQYINENDLQILSKNPLFKGIYPSYELLNCIFSKKSVFTKNSIIIHEGSDLHNLGIILEGKATAYKTDASGKNLIISNLSGGNIFGGILSVSSSVKSPVTVEAAENLTILLIPTDAIIDGIAANCDPKGLLLRNLLNIISKKYFELHDRINCIIRPTLREKILFYLDNCAKEAKSDIFTIPFNRKALADYLNADRSALSRELSKMKKEGIIDFYNESFRFVKMN
ncbi:MAG: Crp/Fnr family transcriptional regulator [Defluviitaleaceae bacterium]|nr:Crp/Fnr family transcriptional regulator [Defluviitaleaceae bacterium]